MVMKKLEEEKIYCSLDIETSGFDPLKDEVLEVGMVVFKVIGEDKKIQVIEEWTQVFKPTKPVEAKILGLTGIKQEELDNAPLFGEFKDEIQSKLSDAVIVGHNVIFDIKFLESLGIKFSGQVIDTLELVQWILPTHHSYNLENLMHYFGISHKNAHRALADAKACLEVLIKLLETYKNFPEELLNQIQKLIKSQKFMWASLLPLNIEKQNQRIQKALKFSKEKIANEALKLENQTIYNFPLGSDIIADIIPILVKQRNKSLLVVPKKQEAIKLWKQTGIEAVWDNEQLFDQKKFELFINKELSPDECRFGLKILVWKFTNWQTTALLDLNLSFFGGQFKQFISGNNTSHSDKAKVLVIDIFTFLNNPEKKLFGNRQIIFVGLAEFENAISLNLSDRVSWGGVNYLLKSIFNPELGIGDIKNKKIIEDLLLASDLFFGIVNALLQTNPPSFVDIAITEEFKNSEKFNKIKSAAEGFVNKLTESNIKLKLAVIEKIIQNLESFFNEEPNRVKWLELSDKRCSLNNSPLHIYKRALEVFEKYQKCLFIDSLAPKEALKYFVDRLGISSWTLTKVDMPSSKTNKDLFSKAQSISCQIKAANLKNEELLSLVNKASLPAAVLFAAPKPLKEFYDINYKVLKTYATLLAQSSSGGNNKLFNNFAINPNGLLLMTDRSLLKTLSAAVENSRPAKLSVKTLIILRLPFDPVSHPYAQALAATYPNAFEAMALPKALHNFHLLISFFNTKILKNVYLFDSKLDKGYAKAFSEYLDQLKGSK